MGERSRAHGTRGATPPQPSEVPHSPLGADDAPLCLGVDRGSINKYLKVFKATRAGRSCPQTRPLATSGVTGAQHDQLGPVRPEPEEREVKMKAQMIRENGGPEVLKPAELERPSAAAGQVLVEVAASSVNTADLMARSMGPVVNFIPTPPAVLGMDFAGTVQAAGEGVTAYKVGDEVYGCAGGVAAHPGTLAEYVAADARLIARKPKAVSMNEAAALPLVAITAFEALFDRLGLQAGQTLLIHGGAGGVGHIAIQLAVAAGAQVFATDSGATRLSAIADLGATPIDYAATKVQDYVGLHTKGRGFDMVFDTVGGANLPNSFAAVKLNGHVATTVSIGEVDLTMAHLQGASLHVIYMLIPLIHDHGAQRHGEILEAVTGLVDAGKVRPIVDAVFPLEDAEGAHRRLESKAAIGKVVVEVMKA